MHLVQVLGEHPTNQLFAVVTSVLGATPTARTSAPPTGWASTTPNARASAPPAPKASAPPAPKASAPPAPKATIPTPPLVAPPATPCAAAPAAPSPVTSDNRLRCDMYVIDPKEKDPVLVASGYVKLEKADKEGNIIIHGVKKKFDDFKRVFIEKVVEENAILPCPIEHEGFDTVGLAMKGKKKVSRDHLAQPTQPPINPKGPNKQSVKRYIPPAKTQLLSALSEIVKNWPAKKSKRYYIKPEVFGGEGQECWISADEVEDVCELHMIGNTVMSLWCSYLQEHTLNLGGLRNTYAFNNPASVSTEAGKLKQRSENLCQRMMGMQLEQWLICPWNSGDHWLTIMIHANTQSVAYLDSTNDFIRTDIMKCIQNAVDMYRIEKNIRNKGPRKSTNTRVDKQILMEYNVFKLDAPYSNEEINAVRDELAEFEKMAPQVTVYFHKLPTTSSAQGGKKSHFLAAFSIDQAPISCRVPEPIKNVKTSTPAKKAGRGKGVKNITKNAQALRGTAAKGFKKRHARAVKRFAAKVAKTEGRPTKTGSPVMIQEWERILIGSIPIFLPTTVSVMVTSAEETEATSTS
ncbi:uncharacterized protein LOC133036062 [Cannabis sativa]|uniref:uncharacterized protein LOC133036062 n=1 Tax=Cannabis sativa TaxID=3483 RepID=UPI0029CA589A|nr:uncharacterized protein LOC133036062 [Cannabis sativa]